MSYFYLCGRMSGIPQFNFPAFLSAALKLRDRGYRIVSPAELDDLDTFEECIASPDGSRPSDSERRSLLRRDLGIVMSDDCVGVICLPGWEESRGALLETYVATAFGKPQYLYEEAEGGISLIEFNSWVDGLKPHAVCCDKPSTRGE